MKSSSRDAEFAVLVREHRNNLVRTATVLTAGDAHLAEDLVQSALSRVYVAWPRIRQTGREAAYARKCVVNVFLDERRRPWRHEQSTAQAPDRPLDRDPFEPIE